MSYFPGDSNNNLLRKILGQLGLFSQTGAALQYSTGDSDNNILRKILGVLSSVGGLGPPGPAGAQGPEGGLLSIIATEDIPQFSVVTSTGRIADSSNLTHINKVVGISLTSIATGFSGPVKEVGEVQNLSWSWVAGDSIYLNGLSLSTIAPISGFSQLIATAKNSSTIIVELGDTILL